MTRSIVALLALSSLAVAQPVDEEAPMSEGEVALVAANNRLAWRLVADWPEDGNRIVVPLPVLVQLRAWSVRMPEGVAAELAAFADVPGKVADDDYSALVARLESESLEEATTVVDDDEVEQEPRGHVGPHLLRLPSAIWVDHELRPGTAWEQGVECVLGAAPVSLDMGDQELLQERVDAWLRESTRGMIERAPLEALGPEPPDVVSISALALRGGWLKPFREEATVDDAFRLTPDRERTVRMMSRQGSMPWAGDELAQVVRCNAREAIAVEFVLSSEERSVRELEARLAELGGLASYRERMTSIPGHLRVPKFEVDAFWDVAASLRANGVRGLFDPERSRIGGVPMPVTGAVQLSTLAVDEEGIEARCVTMMGARGGGGAEPEPFDFHADRPFLVVVRHRRTGAILLIARVADPGDGR